jgi:hypothetical protein
LRAAEAAQSGPKSGVLSLVRAHAEFAAHPAPQVNNGRAEDALVNRRVIFDAYATKAPSLTF